MKRVIVSIVIAVTALTAALAQAGQRAYVDQAGSGDGADLQNVVVSDTNGFLAFKIDGTLVPDTTIEIYIDSDRSQSTGDEATTSTSPSTWEGTARRTTTPSAGTGRSGRASRST